MRRITVMFLAVVLSLSLAGCAGEHSVKTDNEYQEYEELLDMLEDGEFEEALYYVAELGAIDLEKFGKVPVDTEDDAAEKPEPEKAEQVNAEGAPMNPSQQESSDEQSKYEPVEITLDNWQDYFELREYHKFEENGFGEFKKVTTYYSIVSKDGILFDQSKSDVTFEFVCNIESKPYTVDFENRAVIYGEATGMKTSEPTVETMNNVGQYIGESTNDRYGEYLGVCNFISKLEGEAREVVSIEISRIAGDFCVAVSAESGESDEKKGNTSGEVTLGEVAVTKNSEFYVDYSDITDTVVPPQPGDWYSYYKADEDKMYVDFCIAYKNTRSNNIGADEVISAKLKYAGKYEYTGFTMIEKDSRTDFTYSNITNIPPLSTGYVHYLFEVPEEVGESDGSLEISFTVDRNTYTYRVR